MHTGRSARWIDLPAPETGNAGDTTIALGRGGKVKQEWEKRVEIGGGGKVIAAI